MLIVKFKILCWLVYVSIKGGMHSDVVATLFSTAILFVLLAQCSHQNSMF